MNPRPSRNRASGKSAGGKKPNRSRGAGKGLQGAKAARLRIIGGDMRGRVVPYHGAMFTRPMKDNIRENLFNILGRAVKGSLCFDLFAGTGALGFEAISRGAQSSVMIEQHRGAAAFIRSTAEKLDVEKRVRVLVGDTFKLAPTLLAPPADDTPWIVFVCPPYALWQEQLQSLNEILQTVINHAPPGSVLMAETEKKFPAEQLPAGEWDLREYGGTRLAFLEPANRCGMQW